MIGKVSVRNVVTGESIWHEIIGFMVTILAGDRIYLGLPPVRSFGGFTMKGCNILLLNSATVCAALQMYLDDMCEANSAPRVQSIGMAPEPYDSGLFRVVVEEAEEGKQ